jgi:hypothetical protein
MNVFVEGVERKTYICKHDHVVICTDAEDWKASRPYPAAEREKSDDVECYCDTSERTSVCLSFV